MLLQCFPSTIRADLIDALQGAGDAADVKQVLEALKKVPDCADGQPMLVHESKSGGKQEKRGRSAYTEFTGTCMRAKTGVPAPDRMKQCAAEWRAQKGSQPKVVPSDAV